MKVHLTDKAISAAVRRAAETSKRIELADAGLLGLRLRITPSGARSWVLGMRDGEGRARRFPLGEFPALGIGEAREKARQTRQAVRYERADPIAERRKVRDAATAAARGDGTLRAVLNAYGAADGAALRSWPHGRLRIERVFGVVDKTRSHVSLLDRPAESLTVAELLTEADRYKAQASAAFAVRTLRPVLKWAALRNLVPADLTTIQRRETVRRRSRVLSREELARILPALGASPRPHTAALRFMLLTLARREEVCSACWGDVDFAAGTWTIPAERTKNGQTHVVPLSRQAADLLTAVKAGAFVARARRRPDKTPAPTSPVANPGDLVFRTEAGTALGNWDRETKAIHAASKTEGWHRHDLRRTGATMLGEMGELPDIIEAALNHVAIRSQLAATYNRSRYRPQVAAALQRLADALDGIEAGAAEVVPITRAVA
jgi:integrase